MDDLKIQLVDDVIDYFLNSDAFKAVQETEKAFSIPDHQALIETYQKAQDAYQETKKYGAHHPDLIPSKKAFQEAKTALFEQPFMKAYLTAYQTLQTELDAFTQALAQTVSRQISIGNLNVRL